MMSVNVVSKRAVWFERRGFSGYSGSGDVDSCVEGLEVVPGGQVFLFAFELPGVLCDLAITIVARSPPVLV